LPETAKGRPDIAAEPTRNWLMQVAINTHLSQSIGTGALEGQHGMSPAISSDVADIDISSAIADIGASEGVTAMTSRDNGANTSPTIKEIASSRDMVVWRFTPQRPTDTKKLKAFGANDAVMVPASWERPASPDYDRRGSAVELRNRGRRDTDCERDRPRVNDLAFSRPQVWLVRRAHLRLLVQQGL
jgi:hypothetical protein